VTKVSRWSKIFITRTQQPLCFTARTS